MKRVLILISLIAIGISLQNFAYAQEQIGLHFDNYAASSGMMLNPAAPFASPNPWEVNLVSMGLFFENNYAYLDRQSVFSAISAYSKPGIDDPQVNFGYPKKVTGYTSVFVQGPSAFVKLNRFNFGIFTNARSAMSSTSATLTSELNLDTLAYDRPFYVPAFKTTMMNWAEFGVNMGVRIVQTSTGTLSGAVNIKMLRGSDGVYFSNNDPFNFSKIPIDTVLVIDQLVNLDNFDVSYGYSSNFVTDSAAPMNFQFNGKGVGGDIGAIYTIGETSPGKYIWKLGASVVDIGRINFRTNAATYSVVSNGDFSTEILTLEQISNLNEFNTTISNIVYGGPGTSKTGSQFSIGLPTAVILQAERSVGHKFFVGAVAVKRIALSERNIYRPNMIALIPRYESKWISAAIPLEWFDYRSLHAGVSLRLGPLTVGSDNILSMVAKGKLDGTDLYVGLRLLPFWGHGKKKAAAAEMTEGGDTNCPKF